MQNDLSSGNEISKGASIIGWNHQSYRSGMAYWVCIISIGDFGIQGLRKSNFKENPKKKERYSVYFLAGLFSFLFHFLYLRYWQG